MKIAALQMDIAWENRASNFEKVSKFAGRAAAEGADLLILPEMFSTGFSMNTALTAESLGGETPSFVRNLAQKLNMGILFGFVLKRPGQKAQNCALVVDRRGKDIALYAKTHLFSHMGEDKHHLAGGGPAVFDFEGVRCACFICYDLRFPELFRSVCRDVQAVFVIASWPAARARHWDVLLCARAVENQLYTVGVNRTGTGDGLPFGGGSAIIDPMGAVEARLLDEEALLIGDIRAELAEDVRAELPFLKDMRA